MNKKYLFVILLTFLKSMAMPTKQQNLQELFKFMHPTEEMSKAYEPFLASIKVDDEEIKEKIKKKSLEKYFENLKKEFVKSYDKFFDESEVKELVKFYKSNVGVKFVKKSLEISAEMTKAYMSLMPIVKEVTDEFIPKEKIENKNSKVVKFINLAKEKDKAEEIFGKEIKNDGITIVKFSAVWCPPCNSYEPVFEDFANENPEIVIDGKKTIIKYLTIDINDFQKLALTCKVRSVPTTQFYKDGKLVETMTGPQSKEILLNKIKEILKK